MLEFNASAFLDLYWTLRQLDFRLSFKPAKTNIPESAISEFSELIAKVLEHCDDLELESPTDQADRLLNMLTSGATYPNIQQAFKELRQRIDDELKRRMFLRIPQEKTKYYKGKHLLTMEVEKSFPSTVNDIEEAGKCLALGRNTGCVFHLMRVMEVGLRALGASLNNPNLDPKRNPSWESILEKCDKELAKPRNERSPEWKTDGQFFSEATANLRTVKDAWRNPSLHVEKDYDPERAAEVFNSVKAFMRHLATKLHE